MADIDATTPAVEHRIAVQYPGDDGVSFTVTVASGRVSETLAAVTAAHGCAAKVWVEVREAGQWLPAPGRVGGHPSSEEPGPSSKELAADIDTTGPPRLTWQQAVGHALGLTIAGEASLLDRILDDALAEHGYEVVDHRANPPGPSPEDSR